MSQSSNPSSVHRPESYTAHPPHLFPLPVPVFLSTRVARRRCVLSLTQPSHVILHSVFSTSAGLRILFKNNFGRVGLFPGQSSLLSTDNSTICLLFGLLSSLSNLVRIRSFSLRRWITFPLPSFLVRGFYSPHRLGMAPLLTYSFWLFIVSLHCSDARVLGHIISQNHSNLYGLTGLHTPRTQFISSKALVTK